VRQLQRLHTSGKPAIITERPASLKTRFQVELKGTAPLLAPLSLFLNDVSFFWKDLAFQRPCTIPRGLGCVNAILESL
jgi:hypothetical protein